MTREQIKIDYYSDILCVWAWVAQRRIEELIKHFEDKIDIHHQYIDIFGDTATRIQTQWIDKGLYDGFGNHVKESAAPYESAVINPDVWHKTRPTTSANAHMVLKAVELTHNIQAAIDFASSLREAFFVEAKDISNLDIIFNLAEEKGIEIEPINHSLKNGTALAALMSDYQNARKYEIKGSPCFILNNGRQILFGNVGYRVLQSNIEELLNNPASEASWC